MIDQSIIFVNNKTYSIKSSFDFLNDRKTIKLKIFSIDEVDRNSQTSFSQIKRIFSSTDERFSVIKYDFILKKLANTFNSKYRVENIQYEI